MNIKHIIIKIGKIVFDPGFLFTVGNAFLITTPFTIGAAVVIGGLLSLNYIIPSQLNSLFMKRFKSVISSPHAGLFIAGLALVPAAIESFLSVSWEGVTPRSLLEDKAFLSGVASACFMTFNLMMPFLVEGIIKPFDNSGLLKRFANLFLKPENYTTIGFFAVAALAGPLGVYLWPVIAISGVFSVLNSQKSSYSNMGKPKMWIALACVLSAVLSDNLSAMLANICYGTAYLCLEAREPKGFLGDIPFLVRKAKK